MVRGSLFRRPSEQTERKCKSLQSAVRVSDRQERIAGWDQSAMAKMKAFLVGAGGIGGLIGLGLVKKGAGMIDICDHDTVAPENLNRQLFDDEDLFKNKAIAGCRKLSREGHQGTQLIAHPCSFQEVDLAWVNPNVVVVGVDNQIPTTRLDACRAAYARKTPAVFAAVTPDADAGYVIVQKPGEACFECIQKTAMQIERDGRESPSRCPGTPASIDILMLVAGYALYAIDSLIMNRPRNWNYVYLSLSNPEMNRGLRALRRPNCAVCGASCLA